MITDVAMARMVRPGVVTKPLSFLQRPKYFPPGSKIETILTVQVINLRWHLPLCVDPHPLNGTNFQTFFPHFFSFAIELIEILKLMLGRDSEGEICCCF